MNTFAARVRCRSSSNKHRVVGPARRLPDRGVRLRDWRSWRPGHRQSKYEASSLLLRLLVPSLRRHGLRARQSPMVAGGVLVLLAGGVSARARQRSCP